MLVALLARPWILAARRIGAVPRVLADDMRVYARGRDAPQRAARACRATPDFVDQIGGAIAPAKSLRFGNDANARAFLSAVDWGLGQPVPVVPHQ
eukprot:8095911-Lingulodinium_polyedra.AAC.1